MYCNIKNLIRQLLCIYLKNNPGKFHPDPIRNDGPLGVSLKRVTQQEAHQQDE